jgi:glutathione peroxidase
MPTIYDFTVTDIDGNEHQLSEYRGKTLIIVNVASKCGFTPQYEGLEKLYREYKDRGLVVLGFPCDQFGHQEPGDADEIKNFCSLTYDVSFPLFAKIEVNGTNAHPLYRWLKSEKSGFLGTSSMAKARCCGAMRRTMRRTRSPRTSRHCSPRRDRRSIVALMQRRWHRK